MTEKIDHSDTLRSYSFLGGATFINMLLSLIRVKVIALLLGPAGVGLMGLLLNILVSASTLIGLGFGGAGTQIIAQHVGKKNQNKIDNARRVLFWGTMLLALIGGFVVFLLRNILAVHVLDDPLLSNSVGWLALGVALAIASTSQSALITGMRRVGDIAKIQVFSQLSATIIGLALISRFGINGLIFHIIAFPFMAFIVSYIYVAKIPEIKSEFPPIRELTLKLCKLTRMGSAIMIAGAVTAGGQLVVFTLITKNLDITYLGYFQASWGISLIYLSFISAVLTTDFYPKLAGLVHREFKACELINRETEIALLMAAPVIIFTLGALPWIMQTLYSEKFIPGTEVLRWLVVADVLKVASMPLRLLILASGRVRVFLITELVAASVFVIATWALLPYFGIKGGGIGYLIMHLIYLPAVYSVAKKQIGFGWNRKIYKKLITLLLLAINVVFIGLYYPVISLIIASFIAAVYALKVAAYIIDYANKSVKHNIFIFAVKAIFENKYLARIIACQNIYERKK